MKFSDTVKHNTPDLVISKRHDAWLEKNDHPHYSTEAIKFALSQFKVKPRKRAGTVSASSLGECPRQQQFTYLGLKKLPPDPKNAMKMHNGSMVHLRWQMAGISAGWLDAAEVPVISREYGLMGTMDGISDHGAVVEIKSINLNGFSRVNTFGPLFPHLYQMASYMLCSNRTKGAFIYECKDNQEYREIPITADELPMGEVKDAAKAMWSHIKSHQLYEPLSKCIDKEGWQYHSCPFRDRCLKIRTWEDASASRA